MHKVTQVHKVLQEEQDTQVLKEQLVTQVHKVLQEEQDTQVLKVL